MPPLSKRARRLRLTTKDGVIAALGGVLGLCRLTGLPYRRVENWRRLRTFPARYYLVMTWALQRQRLSAAPALWGMLTTADMEDAA